MCGFGCVRHGLTFLRQIRKERHVPYPRPLFTLRSVWYLYTSFKFHYWPLGGESASACAITASNRKPAVHVHKEKDRSGKRRACLRYIYTVYSIYIPHEVYDPSRTEQHVTVSVTFSFFRVHAAWTMDELERLYIKNKPPGARSLAMADADGIES